MLQQSLLFWYVQGAVGLLDLSGMLIAQWCLGYWFDPCRPSAALYALSMQPESSPALMRIPIIGPNLHTWPGASPLYITNETHSQSEEARQTKTADLTEDAAAKDAQQKDGIWLYLLLANGWKLKMFISNPDVCLSFVFNADDVQPSDSWLQFSSPVSVKLESFQQLFSYPSRSACCSISLLSLGVCLCVWFTTARGPAISQPHFWGWQGDRTSWGP